MSFIDVILGKLAPHDCLGCGKEGSLLCSVCRNLLKAPTACCYRCRRASAANQTCADCLAETSLMAVYPAVIYDKLAKKLLWQLKASGAQEAARAMAGIMAGSVRPNKKLIIVPVPTASSRTRERGYDQANLIARRLAKQTWRPVLRCLIRSGQTHQKEAGREQRLKQLSRAYRVKHKRRLRGAHILLVDDVITSGATLEAAANTLAQAGAARIEAVAFARPDQRQQSSQ